MDRKILVLFARDLCAPIASQLDGLEIDLYSADNFGELAKLIDDGNTFEVALLPATLSDSDATWWELHSAVNCMSPKPEVLVCARAANFSLWAGVLDAGGHDVLSHARSSEELQTAVLSALKSFQTRTSPSYSERGSE